jgi:hypothetical protein
MTEYTPVATGRGSTERVHLKTADRKFRDDLILTVTGEWVRADPTGARDFAVECKTLKDNQRQRHGGVKGKNAANLYIKYRIPQTLLDCVRLAMRWAEGAYEMEFEVFGFDDADMKLLVTNFPDLFGNAHNMVWGK